MRTCDSSTDSFNVDNDTNTGAPQASIQPVRARASFYATGEWRVKVAPLSVAENLFESKSCRMPLTRVFVLQ